MDNQNVWTTASILGTSEGTKTNQLRKYITKRDAMKCAVLWIVHCFFNYKQCLSHAKSV